MQQDLGESFMKRHFRVCAHECIHISVVTWESQGSTDEWTGRPPWRGKRITMHWAQSSLVGVQGLPLTEKWGTPNLCH